MYYSFLLLCPVFLIIQSQSGWIFLFFFLFLKLVLKTKRIILIIFLVTLALRLAVLLFYSKQQDTNYWEYGPLAGNMIAGNGYALFYKAEFYTPSLISPESPLIDAEPYPSAYMMPGYPSFLALMFVVFGNKPDIAIFLVQALITAFTTIYIYKITLSFASERTALLTAAIYIFLPEMIYTTVSIGPTVFVHFLLVFLFYRLSKKGIDDYSFQDLLTIGLIMSALLYLRPATIMFVIIIIVYFLFKRYYKQALAMIIVITSLLLPWTIRNYFVFDRFVPFTTSSGLNVYRGHNPYYPGFWQDDKTEQRILKFADSVNYEVKMSDLFMNLSIREIKEHPVKEFFTSFEKLIYLWGYYPYDSRSLNPLYLAPWLFLLVFFAVSLWRKFDWEHKKYLYLFLISCSLTSMLFFALLRYQTIMKITVIPLAAQGLVIIWNLLKKKK
jgi:4-amino-4-deoxy-L-arabinose transferase-like glycosyltransferase